MATTTEDEGLKYPSETVKGLPMTMKRNKREQINADSIATIIHSFLLLFFVFLETKSFCNTISAT